MYKLFLVKVDIFLVNVLNSSNELCIENKITSVTTPVSLPSLLPY